MEKYRVRGNFVGVETFTAIDIETATGDRGSICQIGLVIFEEGEKISEECFLVRPPHNMYVHFGHTNIHGISAKDTVNAPKFPEVWEKIRKHIDNQVIVAHNASFDISALEAACDWYDLQPPAPRDVLCTYLGTGYNLIEAYQSLGLGLIYGHHNALIDANACCDLVLKLKEGVIPNDDLVGVRKKGTSRESKNRLNRYLSINTDYFREKRVVVTGVFREMEREDIEELLRLLGAKLTSSISSKTDFVVIGVEAGPKKIQKMQEMQESGHNIKGIYEPDLMRLLEGYPKFSN